MVYKTIGKVARRRSAKKEEIFTAALALVEEQGKDGLTVHRLAAALDLTPGALYRYFPAKKLLLAELQAFVQEQVLALLRAERAAWSGDGAAGALYRLLAAADFYLSLERREPRYAVLLGLLVGDPRSFQEDAGLQKVAPSALALFDELDALFKDAEEAGALARGPRRERALAYWAALHGATHLMKLEKVEPGLKDNRHYGLLLARTLLTGWGAAEADMEKAWRKLRTSSAR